MPIYEYVCPKCKHKFELMRPMSEARETGVCPNCGSSAPRVLSLFCKTDEPTPRAASTRTHCSSPTCSSCSLGE